MRRRVIVLLLALASLTPACMWDTDTLAEEASFGKDFVTTITGRFPRNPSLYYAMRRDRILAKRVKAPEDYDDLAVAYERLGDSLSALRWIDRKPHGAGEAEYRTHANRGTFLIHAWLGNKLGREACEQGLAELDQALAINPDAHFGRERVQVALVKRFLEPYRQAGEPNLEVDDAPLESATGYAGIVRLGSGWESPDVFRMMAIDLAASALQGSRRLGAVATLSLMRANELVREGHRERLEDSYGFRKVEGVQPPNLEPGTRREYERLRREADAWQARRTDFMMLRLKAGRHPDTDSSFWVGWTEGPPPEIHDYWIDRNPVLGPILLATGAMFAGVAALILLAHTAWRRLVKLRAS